jgi:hypothetical protein
MVFVNKLKLFLALAAFGSLVGCSRCQECSHATSSETICETEFDNSNQYEDAIADAEANGASCISTGGF